MRGTLSADSLSAGRESCLNILLWRIACHIQFSWRLLGWNSKWSKSHSLSVKWRIYCRWGTLKVKNFGLASDLSDSSRACSLLQWRAHAPYWQGRNSAPVSEIHAVTYAYLKPDAGDALLALAPWLSVSGSHLPDAVATIHFQIRSVTNLLFLCYILYSPMKIEGQ